MQPAGSACELINKLKVTRALEKPVADDAQIKCGFNVAGPWNYALWIEAANDDAAARFVKEKIRTINGVTETTIMSAVPLELHIPSAEKFFSGNLTSVVPSYFYVG